MLSGTWSRLAAPLGTGGEYRICSEQERKSPLETRFDLPRDGRRVAGARLMAEIGMPRWAAAWAERKQESTVRG
jgi:hypothetical protein